MKLATAISVLLPIVVSRHTLAHDETLVHHPHRISYDTLLDEGMFQQSGASNLLINALSEHGIVSIKDINGYHENKKNTLLSLHACANDSAATQEHKYNDGTVRLTMATRTVPGPGGQQVVNHDVADSRACSLFSDASGKLRSNVDEAVNAFSARLSSILDVSAPLLSTRNNEYDFSTFEDVVEYGDHLEHFHSYQRVATDSKMVDTIEMHTDQGVFIAFVPAVMVDTSSPGSETSKSKGDFYIQLKDGSRAMVDFDEDDLVIMLGDGINQFINPKVKETGIILRATPHALDMRSHSKDEARVWYGRMVLPPADAIHPEHQETFGRMRELMIDASLSSSKEDEILGLGCSGNGIARQLEEVTCESGSTYCWHRCMEHKEFNVSEAICSERNLQVKCINPREQVYVSGHGDFYPACTDSTEEVTPYPTLKGYPPDAEKCNDNAWDEFSSAKGYEFVFENLGDNRGNRALDWEGAFAKGGNVSKFMWNVDDDMIEGKLVFNGLFGYLALGFHNPGGRHNGMNGASIIMAIPGGSYSKKFGLNLTIDDNVQEYVINPAGSSFRHWSDPLEGRDVSNYNVISTDCFTALTFKTDNINDIKFNVSGTDLLLWAGNNQDYFVGYHGRGNSGGPGDRDNFYVEWKTGKAWFIPPVDDEADAKDDVSEEGAASSGVGTNSLTAVIVVFGVAVLSIV